MDNFEGSSSNCTCSETSRNVVLSEFRRFHTGKRSSGGAVILTLDFLAYSALFSSAPRERLRCPSEPLPSLFYTIKLEKTENGCPTGKVTVCTLVRRRSRFQYSKTLRNSSRQVKKSFRTNKIRKVLISLRSVAILQKFYEISENAFFQLEKLQFQTSAGHGYRCGHS